MLERPDMCMDFSHMLIRHIILQASTAGKSDNSMFYLILTHKITFQESRRCISLPDQVVSLNSLKMESTFMEDDHYIILFLIMKSIKISGEAVKNLSNQPLVAAIGTQPYRTKLMIDLLSKKTFYSKKFGRIIYIGQKKYKSNEIIQDETNWI